MSLRDELAVALSQPSVRAFLTVIRAGEGTSDADGYRRMFGGELFEGYADHPRRAVTRKLGGRPITSTAAGAYQFLSRTWDECRAALELPDFGPQSQDLAAAFLIRRRGALADVLAGRIEQAIAKCNREWASLPGSPYGQPTRTMAQALATYAAAAGAAAWASSTPSQAESPFPTALVEAAAPSAAPPASAQSAPLHAAHGAQATQAAPEPIHTPTRPPEPAMPPFLLAALPSLIQAIPQLAKLFGKDVDTAAPSVVAAAQQVAQIVQDATGAKNVQEAVEAIQADPALLQSATQAVQAQWFALAEAGGGGIAGAGERDATFVAGGLRFWHSPAFWALIALLPLAYMVVGSIVGLWGGVQWSDDVRAAIATAAISLIVGGATGYYWGGTTSGNARGAPGPK